MRRLFLLVTFWNCEDLLEPSLASVAAQGEPATVVLVDDASDEPAASIAKEWCDESERRVLLTHEKNLGPAAARQLGLNWIVKQSQSDQDVVVLLDGDDALAHGDVLQRIMDVYRDNPRILMTLGELRRTSGQRVSEARYQEWHLRRRLVRALGWRARSPRTFTVGLLKRAWPNLRLVWPSGAWLRQATDQALILPMLELLEWHELYQFDEVLYVYNDVRPDGATIEASARGRARQLLGEAYIRRSVRWTLSALPLLVLSTAKKRWSRSKRAP